MIRIPFNRPTVVGRELEYLHDVIGRGHWSGDGAFTRKCSAILESLLGAPSVLLTTSCTHALEMAALLLNLEPGDEVVMPSFTFVSTANAVALRGARPVFVDIRPDTLNMDSGAVEAAITPRTRAIWVVHYAGVACDMDEIVEIAGRYGLPMVEDNAHGLFGHYRGRPLGSFGAMATLSFHETKNVSCGEGGALVINDSALIERAEILREKGTDRSRFFRGQVDKYTWVDVGSSYLPSEINAAVLYAQLEARERVQARRMAIWQRYAAALSEWALQVGAQLPSVPDGCDHPAHLFYVLLPTMSDRDAMIAHLQQRGILAVFHYVPLHLAPIGRQHGYVEADLPITQDVSGRLVRLPLFAGLSDSEATEVIDGVLAWRPVR